ncbi:MAG: PilZ domain-containing protein [Pseudomonadota bacterium]
MSAPAEKLSPASSQDRRRFRRVEISLAGRFMLPNRQEFPCRIVDISPGGARLASGVSGNLGDRVVAYIDQIGRIEGRITRQFSDGLAMSINAGLRKREKLAAQLTWLANRSVLGLPEDRRHDRHQPVNPNTDVLRNDGTRHPAIIVDLSRSGAAVKCAAPLEIGEPVTVGEHRGIVVRLFDNGFAVEFSQMLDAVSGVPADAGLTI